MPLFPRRRAKLQPRFHVTCSTSRLNTQNTIPSNAQDDQETDVPRVTFSPATCISVLIRSTVADHSSSCLSDESEVIWVDM